MSKFTFSKEPAVYIGLLGAIAAAVVHSGAFPVLTDNAAAADVLIAAAIGILIRFFVSPSPAVKPAA